MAMHDPILGVLQDHLTAEEKVALNAPFTVGELGEAAKMMKKRKCPGPDGIPVEMFQELWPVVGPPLTEVLNIGVECGSFPKELTLGHIVLLPKKLDQTLLNNKRPITLLNAAYKLGPRPYSRDLPHCCNGSLHHNNLPFCLEGIYITHCSSWVRCYIKQHSQVMSTFSSSSML